MLGGVFLLIALIALAVCLMTRRRNMERARLELAARSSNLLDPKLMTVGVQIGARDRLAPARFARRGRIARAGLAREWLGRRKPAAEEDEAASEG